MRDGSKVSTLSTGYFDQGQTWETAYTTSFSQTGSYKIQITTESGGTTSNILTYNVQPSAADTSLEIYNPSDRTTTKFIYADQNSVTLTLTNLLSADGKTASQLSSLIGSNKVTWYVDGVSKGTTNAGTTSAVSKSFTLSKGRHLIYATFAENTNLKGSASNFIVVYVGQEPEEYMPTIILEDSTLTPDSHGVYYVPIMQQVTAVAKIYNSTLGSDIRNYVYIANSEVLDTAKFYYNYI